MNEQIFYSLAILSPYAIIALGSIAVLISWLYFKDTRNFKNTSHIALMTLISAYAFLLSWNQAYGKLDNFFLNVSPWVSMLTGLIIMLAVFSIVSSGNEIKDPKAGGEYYFLLMTSVLGAVFLISAKDLLTAFISLELLSMSFYALTGFNLEKNNSEAALKYFMLGSFASVFLAMGIILAYGVCQTLTYSGIKSFISASGPNTMAALAFVFILLGFTFKIALVPLHFWTPDVYEGAPTQISALMASLVKTAGAAAMFYFFSAAVFPGLSSLAVFFACITMFFSNVMALPQKSLKRMLAYSSISHAGYIILGFPLLEGWQVIFYLIVYSIATFGAFSFVYFFQKDRNGLELSDLRGFFYKAPLPAVSMSVFLFSLAGIPPMAGFFGKFYLFSSALQAGLFWPVMIALLSSAISLYYYLRVMVFMFMHEPQNSDKPEITAQAWFVLSVFAALTLALGVFSGKITGILTI